MAGRRRGTGRPTRRVARAERRREVLAERMGRAQTPAAALGAAAEYARSVLADLPASVADPLAAELARSLIQAADRALTR